MYPYYYQNRQNEMLIRKIAKAINGEYSAIQCYSKLAALAPKAEQRSRINEILKDEKKHYQQFTQIYASLTGLQHQPQLTEGCPNDYLPGLEFSLKDEQKTVDFYNEIADQSTDSTIKEVFKRAGADEQNHAVWFLYFFILEK